MLLKRVHELEILSVGLVQISLIDFDESVTCLHSVFFFFSLLQCQFAGSHLILVDQVPADEQAHCWRDEPKAVRWGVSYVRVVIWCGLFVLRSHEGPRQLILWLVFLLPESKKTAALVED